MIRNMPFIMDIRLFGTKGEKIYSLIMVLVLSDVCIGLERYTRVQDGLTSMPNDIPLNVDTIDLQMNKISVVASSSLQHLTRVSLINLSTNKLTAFPDLGTVGKTLKVLYLGSNPISYINPTYLDSLTLLQTLKMGDNKNLNFFPNLEKLGSKLTTLDLTGCSFTQVPTLTHYKHLSYLLLSENPITTITSNDFKGLVSLKTVILRATPIKQVPVVLSFLTGRLVLEATIISTIRNAEIAPFSFVESMGLDHITTLKYVPNICSADLARFQLWSTGSPIDLCSCRHGWLKSAMIHGSNVDKIDDKNCGSLSWKLMSLEKFLLICTIESNPSYKGIRYLKSSLGVKGYFCNSPLHSVHYNVSKSKCLSECAIVKACESFNFLVTDDSANKLGTCVVIAPTTGQKALIDGTENANWSFYAI